MPQIETPFGFTTTAAEAAMGLDLADRRVIVTGAASGIGFETARVLASAGAEVTLAGRDVQAGADAAARIGASTGTAALHVGRLDLADRRSIDAFVADWRGPLHALINNAGVMALPELVRTSEGRELQFAINHLGHFALACGLHDALAAAGDARIVSLSSLAHAGSTVLIDDLDFTSRPYSPHVAYAQSKTANVLFAVEANRRWQSDGITVNAVNPGRIPDTRLLRHVDPAVVERILATREVPPAKTTEQGAATSVFVATSPLLDGIGGRYFEDCNEAPVVRPDGSTALLAGVAEYALDGPTAERLWEVSVELLA